MSKKQIEEFMQELFLARAAEEKRILANRVGYRHKFFTADCRWDSRAGTLGMIETEVIVSIEESDLEARVITAYNAPFYKSGDKLHRARYHLKKAGENWLIRLVENECLACRGQGDESCICCKGKHWT